GLWVVFYKTKIDWFNQTEYYVNLEIGWSASADICDNDAYPEIWFGSVSADRRDILLVNGVRPEMHDFSYQGAEYVLWITPKEEGRVPDVTF
ncbi:MAG: hypothetical protein FWF49_05490, partial [Oscillospiraceae bacterium]|nr:hypothetical protein [Oscillospiraceae bacterium]